MNTPVPDLAERMNRVMERVAAASASSAGKERLADREAFDRESRLRTLRHAWNAPHRHTERIADPSGLWGETLLSLEAKLGRGVIIGIVGERGTGKTQLAVELMKRVTEGGRSALFRTVMELLMLFKASYRKDSAETELDVVRAHRRPGLLVIDEFSRRAETEWENLLLFEILNQRYADMKDTVLICNLARRDLEASLGPHLVSRMHEGGGIIDCNWPAFR